MGIAGNAGVTEGLIYKYFIDKKDLLHQVLNQHFTAFQKSFKPGSLESYTCIEKLEAIVFASLESYAENLVLAGSCCWRCATLCPNFESGAYAMVKKYARTIRFYCRR